MPDSIGNFNLPYAELTYSTVLCVEGAENSSNASSSNASSSNSMTTLSSVPGRQSSSSTPFQSIIPVRKYNSSARYSLKVVKATISGKAGTKLIFNNLQQIYVELTDKSASVLTIKTAVQEEWGDEYTLVTSDGLEVKDSAGTTGSTCITRNLPYNSVKSLYILCRFTILEMRQQEILCSIKG